MVTGGTTGFEICTVAANCKPAATVGAALGGEMSLPAGVATDAAGNVYVADTNNHRIQKFDSSGNFLRAWGEDVAFSGPGNTGLGFEICVAANGDVCQVGAMAIAALGGELSSPVGVATDATGNVYVGDFGHHRVQKFDSSGNFQLAWGKDVASAGTGNTGAGFEICRVAIDTCKIGSTATALLGEMNSPAGVATDAGGNVYMADTTNQRIQKFDAEGVPLRTWGKDAVLSGPDNNGTNFEICRAGIDTCKAGSNTSALGGELNGPFGVGTDTGGNVYVADQDNNRIQKFNSSGNFQRTWGKDVILSGPDNDGINFEICRAGIDVCQIGSAAGAALGGEMNDPRGVATDAAGNVYVAEEDNVRVQRFDSLGNFQRAWGRDVDTGGGVGFEICTVAASCKDGAFVGGVALGGEMNNPRGVAIDAAGNAYVADPSNNRIEKFADFAPPTPPSVTPAAPAPVQPAAKKCRKGQKLKKGRCVKKKKKKKK